MSSKNSDVVDERITKYYLLCTTRNGMKRHIATELFTRTKGNMITKKDFDVYLRPHGDYFAVRDSVVGGYAPTPTRSDTPTAHPQLHKIMVFDY